MKREPVMMLLLCIAMMLGSCCHRHPGSKNCNEVKMVAVDRQDATSGDTVKMTAKKLTLKVVDCDGSIVRNCHAALTMVGDGIPQQSLFTWDLSDKAETTVCVYSQGSSAVLMVYNGSGFCATKAFPYGITEDTKLIFDLQKCK